MYLRLAFAGVFVSLVACDRSRIQTREELDAGEASGAVMGGGSAETGGGSAETGGGVGNGGGTAAEPPCSIEAPDCSFFLGDAGTGPATPTAWAKSLFRLNSYAVDVVIDSFGDVVVAGFLSESVDFGAGMMTIEKFHPFVVKYAADGKLRWVRVFREYELPPVGVGDIFGWTRMAVREDGAIFLAGATSKPPFDGIQSDLFLAGLTREGAVRWRQGYPEAKDQQVSAIELDGDVFWVTGSQQSVAGRSFVAKFSTETGRVLLGVPIEADRSSAVSSLAVLGDHGVMIAGSINGSVRIGSAPAMVSPDSDSYDAFLVRLSPTGAPLWNRLYGTAGGGQGILGLKPDGQGGAYAFGYFSGTLTGLGDLVAEGEEVENPFLARVDGSGATVWSRRVVGRQSLASYNLLSVDAQGVFLGLSDDVEGQEKQRTVAFRSFTAGGSPTSERVFMDGAELTNLYRRNGAMALAGVQLQPGSLLGIQPDPSGKRSFIAYLPR